MAVPVNCLYKNGKAIEGNGVEPDIVVSQENGYQGGYQG